MANYPELGPVDTLKPKYREGDEYTHPSGVRYRRIQGNWVAIAVPEKKADDQA